MHSKCMGFLLSMYNSPVMATAPTFIPASPSSQRPALTSRWGLVPGMFLFAIIYQGVFLACACSFGQAKFNAALMADVAILLRALVAMMCRDDSGWWRVYLALYFLIIPIILVAASLMGAH